MSEYSVYNILDMLDKYGENDVSELLSQDFECPINPEIEYFAKNNAIDFAKRKSSITYLVFDNQDDSFVGYFTLTHKSITIKSSDLSRSAQKRMMSHAILDESTDTFTVSAYLIAQFGKNFKDQLNTQIDGSILMDFAIYVLLDAQRRVGGGVVFLECIDNQNLLAFYESERNNFKRYGIRSNEKKQTEYIQLMRFLK